MINFMLDKRSGALQAALSGRLDENAHEGLFALAETLTERRLILNCQRVTFINSVGVRIWLDFIARLTPAVELALEALPVSLMQYAMIVDGFFGRGQILSFFAPCVCNDCKHCCDVKIDVTKAGAVPPWPLAPCAKCAGVLRIEDDESEYARLLDSTYK